MPDEVYKLIAAQIEQMELRLRDDLKELRAQVQELRDCTSQNAGKLDKLWADAQVEEEGREIIALAMKYPKVALLIFFILMQAASVLFTGVTVRSDVQHMLKELADGDISTGPYSNTP